MNKCSHGVYIPERMDPLYVGFSDCCSICQTINPDLDSHYGLEPTAISVPFTLNSLYEDWFAMRSQALHDKLFYVLRRLAKSIAREKFHDMPNLPPWGVAAQEAAENCLLDIKNYNPAREASFSTWAHIKITSDLSDWLKCLNWEERSIDDPEHPIDVVDPRPSPFDKLLVKEVKALLTEEEMVLWEQLADGLTQDQIAEKEGVSQKTISKRRSQLIDRLQVLTSGS